MTTLVFGKTGQVAQELALLSPKMRFLGRDEVDLSDPGTCERAIGAFAPDAVINAAAYTAVDKAEDEEDIALQVNGRAPALMAKACQIRDIPFVHISTDYVFDGTGDQPFLPEQATSPLGAYGRTKLAGEDGVRAAGGRSAIFRTSWVFSAHGNNFLKTMLRLSETRDTLTVVGDQIGGPTDAGSIAALCLNAVETLKTDPNTAGTYHFSGAPDASWAVFARVIFEAAGRQVAVTDIPSSDYPTPAKRPLNSRLDCTSSAKVFGVGRPDWKAATKQIVATLT